MREIIFRGKRIDNGEWVKGSPIFQDGYVLIRFWNSEEFEYEEYLVDPESVSEYTGLTDKNGTKIFEGDIVKGKDNLERNLAVGGYIDYGNGSFVIVGEFMTHYRWLDYELEVIGNIHDNPELLKGGDEE